MSALEESIKAVLTAIEEQLNIMELEAERRGVGVTVMQNMNGDFCVVPLLVARANLLSSLAFLENQPVLDPEPIEEPPAEGRMLVVTETNHAWVAHKTHLSIHQVQAKYTQSVRDGVTCMIPLPSKNKENA